MIHIKILKITTSIVLFLQILRLPSHRQPTKNRLLVKKMAGSLFKNMPQPLVLQPRGIPRALCIHGREEDITAGSQR